MHFKYIAATKHTVTQPAHATFLSRDHHDLHIPSLLLTQLQGRARELDVRLNSPDPTQHAPPLDRLAAMIPRPNDHTNLSRNAIISLAQFGLHLRDADQLITSLSLYNYCSMTTPIEHSLVNHPRRTKPPQTARLPSQATSRYTLLTPTIRTCTNGSIPTSYKHPVIRSMTPSPPHLSYTTPIISKLLLWKPH